MDQQWHTKKLGEVLHDLRADVHEGLSSKEVLIRRTRYGENIFAQEKKEGILKTIITQFKNPLVFILLLAGAATLLLGEYVNAVVVFIALFINVGIGTLQEYRASKSFEKLAESQERRATVIRDGKKQIVIASELVPGDVVVLVAGAYVPADMRLIRENDLEVNESALTGEWVAVHKELTVHKPRTPLAERDNMAWMGTLVASGTGAGVVVATGATTELGSIAESLDEAEDTVTPIQKNIRKLAHFLAFVIMAIVIGIFVLGILRGETVTEMALLAIAIAVSVIPEGLPAAVAAVLAIGMEKILEKKGLVRNLLAAETLGSTTVIITDKTGTLTQARMSLAHIITAGEREEDQTKALEVAVLSSDAFVEHTKVHVDGEATHELVVRGRPMEKAIVQAGLEKGFVHDVLEKTYRRIDFVPFESEKRFAASLNHHTEKDENVLFVSGAPEFILQHAKGVWKDGRVVPLGNAERKVFEDALIQGGSEGMRFVAIGFKKHDGEKVPRTETLEAQAHVFDGLVMAGLLAFSDPLREEVPAAIKKAQEAGARIIMATGDNRETALSIAREAGVVRGAAHVLEGRDIENLSDKDLWKALQTTDVFARVLPRQKLRLVKQLQAHGEVVAMTGDGINDAPALRNADVGIAVGSGTEVAKEASDLILLNNSFSIIVAAIEEGRRIIDNLKKVIVHLLSTSFHSVFLIAGAIVAGFALPVLPVQILWVNIIEEGLMTFAFAFEPPEKGVMKRDPRSRESQNILTREIKQLIFLVGIVTSVFSLALYFALHYSGLSIGVIRTIMFVVLSLDSIFFALSIKTLHRPFWEAKFSSNKYLLFAVGTSTILLILTLILPPLKTLLSLETLSFWQFMLLVGVGIFNLLTIEIVKWFVFQRHSRT